MKKIITISVLFLFVITSYGQKKPLIIDNSEVFTYTDVENILSNKNELRLTPKQEAILVIKNEYIKRDLLTFNERTDMLFIEKRNTEKKIINDYNTFIARTLNQEQMEVWKELKVNLTQSNLIKGDLNEDLALIKTNYKNDRKETFRKFKGEKVLYKAQVSSLQKKYNTDIQSLKSYYNTPENANDVLSLEEISNLIKEFDELENTNPLEYLNISETTNEENEDSNNL